MARRQSKEGRRADRTATLATRGSCVCMPFGPFSKTTRKHSVGYCAPLEISIHRGGHKDAHLAVVAGSGMAHNARDALLPEV
jgi:hypothetical protein